MSILDISSIDTQMFVKLKNIYSNMCKFIGCISDILRRPALSGCISYAAAYVPLPAEDSANV